MLVVHNDRGELTMIVVMLKCVEEIADIHSGYACIAVGPDGSVYDIRILPFRCREYEEVARKSAEEWLRQHKKDDELALVTHYYAVGGPENSVYVNTVSVGAMKIADIAMLVRLESVIIEAIEASSKDAKNRRIM